MKKKLFIAILALTTIISSSAQLVTYPALPSNHLMSAKYSVKVKLGAGTYQNSYVYQYLVKAGTTTNKNIYDPYNVVNSANRNALTNNHWTTISYKNNGNNVTFEITKIGGSITSCTVLPSRYGYKATISGGKALVTVNANSKYIYCLIDGNVMDPLFLFIDPLETNIPTASSATVKYFGPGIHDIGLKWTPASGITQIYIAGGALVKGTIYTNNRSNLKIHGRGIISGEGYDFQSDLSNSAIYLNGSGTEQVIEGITSMKPCKYHLISRGTLATSNVKCFSFNTTTDGWGGGINSTLSNSFFKCNDDVTKLYSDNMKIKDIVCYHQTNTPIFEFGWSGQTAKNCLVERLDIVEDRHVAAGGDNGGIIGWAGADAGKTHSGHIFRDIRSDCEVNFLFHIHVNNSCSFTCENWNIKSTRLNSTSGNGTKVAFNCVKIDGKYITKDEMNSNTSAAYTFNSSNCTPGFAPKSQISTDEVLSNNSNIKGIYPNPTKSSFKVVMGEFEKSKVDIYATNGQLVKTAQLLVQDKSINTEELAKGVYVVIVSNNSEQFKQTLIIE